LLYTLNFHAGLLSAEDHLLLEDEILPFVMNVVAAMPLKSASAIIALHAAGKLELAPGKAEVVEDATTSGTETRVRVEDEGGRTSELCYRMFVDCSGQKPLHLDDFPFPALVKEHQVIEARVSFSNPATAQLLPQSQRDRLEGDGEDPALKIGGVRIADDYQLVSAKGSSHGRIYDIAFPHVTGLRPYSYGLQACNETAAKVVRSWICK
jgi:hypothetical protein